MDLVKHATAYPSKPAPSSTGSAGYFHPGSPSGDIPSTYVTADFLNGIASELKNTIEDGGLTLDINNDTLLRAAVATLGSRRNQVMNPIFAVWQRGSSLPAGTSGLRFLADRWANESVGSTYAADRVEHTLGEIPGGARYFHRTTVSAVVGAGNYAVLRHRMEDVRYLAGGAAVVSFWARASTSGKSLSVELAQVFGVGGSATVTGIGSTKIALTTTWTRYSVKVDVPSIAGKTLATSHLTQLTFWLDAGADFNARTGSLGSQSGTFDISTVSVRPGNADAICAPLSYGEELARCQRYYEKSFNQATDPAEGAGASGAACTVQTVAASTGTFFSQPVSFKVTKRVSPTITLFNPVSGGAAAQARNVDASVDCTSTSAAGNISVSGFELSYTSGAGTAANQRVRVHWTAECEI